MEIDGRLNIWGEGQLFAYSGVDGETDFRNGLVLRSRKDAAFDLVLPGRGVLKLSPQPPEPERCFLSSDCFKIDGTRGVMPDCHHLLIEGEAAVELADDTLKTLRKGRRTLIGEAHHFRPDLIDADLDGIFAARRAWFAPLPDFGVTDPVRLGALAKAYSQLKGQINSPCPEIPYSWTTPDRWPHRCMWLWDSVFHAIGLRHFNLEIARESLRAVLSQQLPDGMIPHMMSPEGHSEITQPPILAFGVAMIQEAAPDPEFVREVFPKIERHLEWIFANRDSDGNGLVEWFIEANPVCRSGESGMDNSPRFDSAVQLDATDFNSYLSLECETMAAFAAQLGMSERADYWKRRHAELNERMNQLLWNEEQGIYMDRDVNTGTLTGIAASSGFLPLLCGAPSPEQAARLVANLNNPARFATPLRVPSISRDNPEAYSRDLWRGPVWININYLIARGLERCGYPEEARRLLDGTVAVEEHFYQRYGTFFEFYDDRCEFDPPQLLRKGKCAPQESPYHQVLFDYGWSATLYIDMVAQLLRRS